VGTQTHHCQECRPKPEPSWAAWVVITGLVAIVIVFVVAVLHYDTATQVTTSVGAVSGVIAALVGTYFGIRGSYTAQKIAANVHKTHLHQTAPHPHDSGPHHEEPHEPGPHEPKPHRPGPRRTPRTAGS
jgi:ABC-type nickel/cobalt efflux system permease component RcnA